MTPCPYCRSPQDPTTGHCSTVGCGNAAKVEGKPRSAIERLFDVIESAGAEAYFVPPPGHSTICACTWPGGYPGMPKLSETCPIPQHARLAKAGRG